MNDTPSGRAAMQHSVWPAGLILLGMVLLPGMDAIAKALTGLASVVAISFGRNLTQLVIMAPFAWRDSGGRLWPLAHWRLHMLRGFFMVSSGMLFFAGVQRLPLADNMAISFLYPFIVAAVAPLVLRERSSLGQMCAVALGFAGTLIIIRPGSNVFGTAALLPLTSALGYAGYVLVTRGLARADAPTSVLQFWMAVFGSLWILPVIALGALLDLPAITFHLANGTAVLGIIGMGLFGTVGHWLVTTGARHVSASIQAGLGYSEIITATLLGWLFWRDFPDPWTWLGIAVVVGSGLWLMQLQTARRSA